MLIAHQINERYVKICHLKRNTYKTLMPFQQTAHKNMTFLSCRHHLKFTLMERSKQNESIFSRVHPRATQCLHFENDVMLL